MPRKPGSIYAIEGGKRLRAVVQVKDELGFPKPKTFTTTDTTKAGKKALQQKITDFLETYNSHIPAPDMTVTAMCEVAIDECKRLKRSKKTIGGYQEFLDWHIKPTIGKMKIRDLKPFHVERMLKLMAEGKSYGKREEKWKDAKGEGKTRIVQQVPASTQTQLLCRNFLRMSINRVILKNSVKDVTGFPLTNAAAFAETEKVVHQQRKKLPPDAADLLLSKEPNKVLRALWLFLMETGLRPDEALNLTWHNIYREHDGLWLKLDHSKTEEGKEPVPLSSLTEEAILAVPKSSAFVFPTSSGTPWSYRNMYRAWKALLARAKLPYTNPYQMRKLFGTLKARYVRDEVLKRLMRHTDIRTTKQHYVDALDQDLRAAVEE